MESKSFIQSILDSLSSLSGMPVARQGLFMLVLAATLSLALALVLWSVNDDYVPLYPGISVQDTAEISAVLDQQGTQYRIEPGTGLLTVSSSDAQRIKLALANQGLPRTNANNGFSMLYEDSPMGTSQFIEQARFTRALEQELTMTVKLINGVRDARVHLSVPKQTSFIRSSSKPSASVMLDLMNGMQLSDNQISGITHLVASSVAGLTAEDVSIVDQRGTLLSRGAENDYTVSSDHFMLTRGLERDYTQRIMDILTPIVGVGNVRTQVTAELDFTMAETTNETYNPASSVIRSEQVTNESQSSAPANTPGALALAPPFPLDNPAAQGQQAGAAVPIDSQQARTSTTRNFEIDKSISYRKSAPGTINRLSVAVVVDLGSALAVDAEADADAAATTAEMTAANAEKLERLKLLIQDAVGFNAERGDTVYIANEPFSSALEEVFDYSVPLWTETWFQNLAKQIAVMSFALFIAMTVLKPAMRMVLLQKESQAALGSSARAALPGSQRGLPMLPSGENEDGTNDGRGQLVVGLNQFPSGGGGGNMASSGPSSEYDQNVTVLQRLVEKEPMRVSKMISDWAAKD
jgi:flagellar M-ring protein FliF